MTVRTCLVSPQKQSNESENDELKTGMELALAVFPKSMAFFQPGKRAFNNPPFRQHSKGVQFIAFDNLNISIYEILYRIRKRLAQISAITQDGHNRG